VPDAYPPSPLPAKAERLATVCCSPRMEQGKLRRNLRHPHQAADLHQLPWGSSNLELSLPAPGTGAGVTNCQRFY